MIVVDTSALAAIVFRESDRTRFRSAIMSAGSAAMSSGTLVEVRIVLYRRGGAQLVAELEEILAVASIEIVPVDREQADIAHEAFMRYGKGSGHPAGLNFGDLFAYALAKTRGVPLLFKGEDFMQTDVEPAA